MDGIEFAAGGCALVSLSFLAIAYRSVLRLKKLERETERLEALRDAQRAGGRSNPDPAGRYPLQTTGLRELGGV